MPIRQPHTFHPGGGRNNRSSTAGTRAAGSNRTSARNPCASMAGPQDRDRTVPDKQIHRWMDDGGADLATLLPPAASMPPVWSPPTMNARLSTQQALDAIPRRTWGISAEARVMLARIVADVDRRALTQPDATDQLRELTRCLLLHRQAEDAIENGCDRSPWSRSLLDH